MIIPSRKAYQEGVAISGRHLDYMGYAVDVLDQGMLVHCNGDRSLIDPGERGTHPQFSHLDYGQFTSLNSSSTAKNTCQ